ncbi:MAG: MFS transporter [Gammaproteobacteria bacterium]|jgi:MFS family permease|nr:MFS transporter [Gammaproteobacteria bacterium]MBT5602119.1 MFS transporter [Gammaproteobacteria bacterium]
MGIKFSQYFWYMAGLVSFVAPAGLQAIVYPWLIVVELGETPERLGIAQMCLQLPAIVLILMGGLLADRVDRRLILMTCHFFAAMPALGLAWLISEGSLSYAGVIFYGLLMGSVTAFAQPARDGMLSEIAQGELQKVVTVAIGLTFGGQVIGYFAGGFAEQIGVVRLLVAQAIGMLCGIYFVSRLHSLPGLKPDLVESGQNPLIAGFKVVLSSPVMLQVSLLTFAMSVFYGGTYVVLIPLIVRDVYQGGAAELSYSFVVFVCGTLSMTTYLVKSGGLASPLSGLKWALVIGGLFLVVTAQNLPFWGFLMTLFCWGLSGAVTMSMSRTIIQQIAPEQFRARVLAVFNLANLGGLPIGALGFGYSAAAFGTMSSLYLASIGIWLAVVISLVIKTKVIPGMETEQSL